MFNYIKKKRLAEKLQRERRITLNFLHKLTAVSGDINNNIIYIPYEYNDYSYKAIQYRVNISGNIEIYSEIGQLIFAGNNVFDIYDFISEIILDNSSLVMKAMISALKHEYK